ncbi:MAG: ABC-F family ATP-binding cassette domain-containing protein [Flavobacteriales bacterium]
MNYLSVDTISKSYGERVLFESITFGISKGDKIALIANNGSGKSTLLKIIASIDNPDEGKISFKKGVSTAYLPQVSDFDDNLSIREVIDNTPTKVRQLIKEYNSHLKQIEKNNNTLNNNILEELTNKMDKYNAWDYDSRIQKVLSIFNLNDTQKKISTLSGGQKKRLSLALLLIDDPELLLLDEPTNHLDIEMIEWLEKYLQQQSITLLMVTHDRYFLDRVCNRILELEDGTLYNHKGNYSYFLEKRAIRESNFNTELSKAGKLLKKELEWIRQSPKARTTKSKARINSFNTLKKKVSGKKIKQELKLDVKMSRVGGKILELKKVYKSYNNLKILQGFDYTFKKGDRIGIIGKNGVGKSTFLNIITGNETADSGKINIGETIVFGYFSQNGIEIKEDKRVIDCLKDIAEVIEMSNGSKITASQLLTHFMFPPNAQHTYISKLSGGEQRRLFLLMTLMKNPNFLILDEPTNDLDLITLNRLEEFLIDFQGCLLIVSHDRYFMDKLTNHLFIFKGDGVIKDEYSTYSEFRQKQIEEEKENKSTHLNTKNELKNNKSNKVSYKDKYEYEQLSKEIQSLEKDKKNLEEELINQSLSFEEIQGISLKLNEVITELDSKTDRWIELDELF